MKSNLVTFARNPFRMRGFRRPTLALLAGLALMGGTTFVLHAQLLSIEKAGLISWPDPTEEQIVVGSDSPTGPVWTPWPEPIFKRFGQMCMTVPTVATQQFFKTVPGRQFLDDFSDAWGPFTNRDSWVSLYQDATDEWVVTNGVLQLIWSGSDGDVFGLFPLATNAEARLRDFCTSVDILDWVIGGTNKSAIALVGRGILLPGGVGKGYFGGLTMNADGIPGNARLWIRANDDLIAGTNNFNRQQYPPPYRLQLTTVWNSITVRVLNPTTGQMIVPPLSYTKTSSTISYGFAGLLTEGHVGTDSYTITADNYILIGTKP